MEKKNIDWSSLGFGYIKTDKRFVANYKDGAWDNGTLTEDDKVVINECAGVLQYAQTCFEGLKAYTTEDGHIVMFRPDLNAARMKDSCERLEMPVYPEDKWVEAVAKTVEANAAWVPPFGSGVDRAAPHGTGHIKAGLNYAMSLHAIMTAHEEGYAENMYLDPATRTKVEETGGANFIFITKDGKFVTPKSNSILPSITRRSLMVVAKEYLGLEVEEREVLFDEVKDFAECGLCGTAAVISPVGKINDHGKEICFPSGMEKMGPTIQKLYDTLTGIQMGKIEAPKGWIYTIA